VIARRSLFTWRLVAEVGNEDGEGDLAYPGWFNLHRTADQQYAL